jgi:hypothetical protein
MIDKNTDEQISHIFTTQWKRWRKTFMTFSKSYKNLPHNSLILLFSSVFTLTVVAKDYDEISN